MQKDVVGFNNYFVTDTGEVFSKNYHRENRIAKLQPRKLKNGYLYVSIRKNKMTFTKKVHNLVATAFLPNPNNKPQINHKNGIKTDNRVENLEWCTASENIKHSYDVLHRQPNRNSLGKFGKDNPRSKLVLQIKDNNIIKTFYGLHDAERETGISRVSIKLVCQGKRKSAGGYQWQYKK